MLESLQHIVLCLITDNLKLPDPRYTLHIIRPYHVHSPFLPIPACTRTHNRHLCCGMYLRSDMGKARIRPRLEYQMKLFTTFKVLQSLQRYVAMSLYNHNKYLIWVNQIAQLQSGPAYS